MVQRITQSSIQASSLHQLQLRLQQYGDLHERMATGKRVNRPSDDPSASIDIMRIRGEQKADAQYARNTDNAISWLQTIDETLMKVSSELTKARTLTLQGANTGAMSQAQRDAIATPIEAISDALLAFASTSYNGRLVFAGTSSAASTYSVGEDGSGNRTFSYEGFSGSKVERQVASATSLRVDSDGSQVFGDGEESVFALLDTIARELREGNDISQYVKDIDVFRDAVLSEAGRIGSRTNQAVQAKDAITDRGVTLSTQLASIEETDMISAPIELMTLEVGYQAALLVTARVLQPSLLDYLR